jgi:hypothetical protein
VISRVQECKISPGTYCVIESAKCPKTKKKKKADTWLAWERIRTRDMQCHRVRLFKAVKNTLDLVIITSL